ncbi:MAG: trypsin-like serine protease, partial [Pseudomonadota bacterium]
MLRTVRLVAAALALWFSAVASAGADAALKTLRTADDNRGWEAVGRLNIQDQGFCTASLITADIVMTAAHCLFDKTSGDRVPADQIEFQAGLRFGRAEAYRGIRR